MDLPAKGRILFYRLILKKSLESVPSSRGSFWGRNPRNKAPSPPKLNYEAR